MVPSVSSESIEDLLGQLTDRRGLRRQRAREALVDMAPATVPALLDLADAPNKRLRWEVTKALAEIEDPRSIQAFVERLADPESDIRWLAATGLIRLGPRAIPAVLRAVIAHPDSQVLRRAAHHVLHDLAREDASLDEVLSPVMTSLGDIEPASAIPPKAQEALQHLEVL
jgi:HEAT repeat protein